MDNSPAATAAVEPDPGHEPGRQPAVGSSTGPAASQDPAQSVPRVPVPAVAAAAANMVRRACAAPEDLHPALWRATQVGRAQGLTQPSGFAALDAELPGGGWPARTLTELLLPRSGIGEMRLLAPVLAASARGAMLFDPPDMPCGWALAALGLDLRQWVLVRGRDGGWPAGPGLHGPRAHAVRPAADILWALEQTLASGQAGVVLAWLPAALRADALRRLQLAAQAHDAPGVVLRAAEARQRPSVAPLRLLLGPAGPDELRVQILKRRGPPLARALTLALPPVLAAGARSKALRLARYRPDGVPTAGAPDALVAPGLAGRVAQAEGLALHGPAFPAPAR